MTITVELKIKSILEFNDYDVNSFIQVLEDEMNYKHIISISGIHRFINTNSNEAMEFNESTEEIERWL